MTRRNLLAEYAAKHPENIVWTPEQGWADTQRETKPEHIKLADYFAGMPCTLNGKPAKIMGRLLRFATIATLNSCESAQYDWESVRRIMDMDTDSPHHAAFRA